MDIVRRLLDLVAKARFKSTRGVVVGAGFRLVGAPIVTLRSGGQLELGKDVLLNSKNTGYNPITLFSPVNLLVGQKGKLTIGEGTRIHGSGITAVDSVEIGKRCLIAGNCQITDWNGHDLSFDDVTKRGKLSQKSSPVLIGDDVWLGTRTLVLPGVSIGTGSVVCAGSVVSHDIPDRCLAGGVPAEVIKQY